MLERPLPWVPFLLLIVLLRLARIWLSVGALLIGNGPVSPRDTIYFIQTRRRKLRAIRLHGLRVMRDRQQRVSSLAGKSFTQKVSQWMSRAICRPGVHHNEPQQVGRSNSLFQLELAWTFILPATCAAQSERLEASTGRGQCAGTEPDHQWDTEQLCQC